MILSRNDILVLNSLDKNFKSLDEISEKTGLSKDAVRRSIEFLKKENLVNIKTNRLEILKLTDLAKKYVNVEFPQEKLLEIIKDKIEINELSKKIGKYFNIALGLAKKEGFIKLENGYIVLNADKDKILERYKKIHKDLQKIINKQLPENKELLEKEKLIFKENKNIFLVFKSKNADKLNLSNVKTETISLTKQMLKTGDWKNKVFKKYNVEAEVDDLNGAKFQPYKRFLDLIRKKLTAMGFEEMSTELITTEFFNFDVLFQPQNHPARTWTDTYSLKKPNKGKLPEKEKVDLIKAAHETGGKANSKGWRYKWNPEIAMKLMPAAQGTAFSAKKMFEGIKVPKRYFAIAHVYRPDVLDATHLNEFNQLEGFVIANKINFKHLLGLLKQFAIEVAGAEDVMFYPDYYPFTEPSVQMSAKHPKLGWVEFGGAGIFRPEITENLGIKQRVIAWGLGIDRLAMFNLGINDIRQLFSQNIDWLRKKPIVEKI